MNQLLSSVTAVVALVGIVSLGGCASKVTSSSTPSESARLEALISEYTDAVKRLDPFNAPYFNVEEDFDKFGDYPSSAFRARHDHLIIATLDKAKSISREKLESKDRRAFDLFRQDLEVEFASLAFPDEYLEFNQMWSRPRSYLDDSSPEMTSFPFDSVQRFDAWIKRSEGFPIYVDRQIELLREGVKRKLVLNCTIARKTMNSFKEGLEPQVEKHAFLRALTKLPLETSSADRERLKKDFRMMVTTRIQPGFRKLDRFLKKEYLPHCRQSYGLTGFSGADRWYENRIWASTGLRLKADEIHQIGLSEVARIHGEMEKIKAHQGFKGSLKAFLKSRRDNPANYFAKKDDLLRAFAELKEKVALLLPKYFSELPKSDYRIVESENPEDAAASYHSVTEVLPYGRFVVNTLNLKSTDRAGVTTLSLHEANPGHHLQLALSFEKKAELSEYQRKIFESNAFTEGWALYAEFLGREMGLYADEIQLLGHLNDEMLRAVRLVVDTGIHAKGWSREKTIRYMMDNLASDRKGIEAEADRYSVWPGQALGYKIGQLKILELRRRAEKLLGSRFDIRAFHRAVIGSGTVSLSVLEQQVHEQLGLGPVPKSN